MQNNLKRNYEDEYLKRSRFDVEADKDIDEGDRGDEVSVERR